jgi:uncharacterized RDD family membrane protein YckC
MNEPSTAPCQPGASLWRRFSALIYDSLILLALSMGYGALITSLGLLFGGSAQDYKPMFHSPLVFIGWLVVLEGFFVWSWVKSGQTLGMRAWRLQLVDRHSQRSPSLKQTLLRSQLAKLSLLGLGAGYFYRWFNPTGDCWHDRITHTQVRLLPKRPKT